MSINTINIICIALAGIMLLCLGVVNSTRFNPNRFTDSSWLKNFDFDGSIEQGYCKLLKKEFILANIRQKQEKIDKFKFALNYAKFFNDNPKIKDFTGIHEKNEDKYLIATNKYNLATASDNFVNRIVDILSYKMKFMDIWDVTSGALFMSSLFIIKFSDLIVKHSKANSTLAYKINLIILLVNLVLFLLMAFWLKSVNRDVKRDLTNTYQTYKYLFNSNYFELPEVFDMTMSLCYANAHNANVDELRAKFNAMIILDNWRMSDNLMHHDTTTSLVEKVKNDLLDSNIKRVFITLNKEFNDKRVLKIYNAPKSDHDQELKKLIFDDMKTLNSFLVDEINFICQQTNKVVDKQDVVDYYLSFNKAGRMLAGKK